MAGFNLPVNAIPPQLLAEMARAAFRPPALMGGGGGGGGGGSLGSMPQAPGFNLGQGMAGMGAGLGALAGALGKDTGIDAEIKDWSSYGTPAGRAALDQMMAAPAAVAAPNLAYGGPRADGGAVRPGEYYTVGERGPETFVPAVPGQIVPTDPNSVLRDSEIARMLFGSDAVGSRQFMPPPPPSEPVLERRMPAFSEPVLERDFFGGRRSRR